MGRLALVRRRVVEHPRAAIAVFDDHLQSLALESGAQVIRARRTRP
jgi:hypothetical protein